MANARYAFVNSEPAAQGKDIDGHQQRVEVKSFAVTIGMQSVCWTSAALHAQEEQQFVTCIYCGVNRLGQHGGTSSDGGSYVLCRRDRHVGCDGRVNYFLGSSRRHAP
jgi:hypothetical protein